LINNTTGAGSVAVGYRALYLNTSALNNTAIGNQALAANTTGDSNVAVGAQALDNNTTASNNTAVGYQSLYSNTTGYENTAVGYQSLLANIEGFQNTAVGQRALEDNTYGDNNVAIGDVALADNTTANNNVAVGVSALRLNTTASNNTAVGYQAANSSSANNTTCFGYQAGLLISSGIRNTMIGSQAGNASTTTGQNVTCIGFDAQASSATVSNEITLGNASVTDVRIPGVGIQMTSSATGSLLVGSDGASSSVGCFINTNGSAFNTRDGGLTLVLNRLTNDGELVQFRQDNTIEGTISVSGTTVSYNGGHLSRFTQLPDSSRDETILKGTVLSNLDDMCVYVNADTGESADNEQLNKVKVSDVEGDTNVAGVHVSWIYDEQHDVEEINMAMTGDMIIRIAQGVNVNRGDLLMSAGDGTAKPQGDDIVRSKTIAKVTSTSVTCTYEDGSYCVPCVLMAC